MIDKRVAELYLSKIKLSKQRGIDFELSFNEFKRLITAKRCKYSGLELTDNSRTIERIDNSIGYLKSNCIPCHKILNTIKGMTENDNNPLELKHLKKMLKYLGV